MQIKICTFSSVKKICGFNQQVISFPESYNAGLVIDYLLKIYPALNKIKDNLLLAINDEYCNADTKLKDGDTLAVFPPVSGG